MKNIAIIAVLICTFLGSALLGAIIQHIHFPTASDLELEASMKEPLDCKPLKVTG